MFNTFLCVKFKYIQILVRKMEEVRDYDGKWGVAKLKALLKTEYLKVEIRKWMMEAIL